MKKISLLTVLFFSILSLHAGQSVRLLRGFVKCNNIGVKNVVVTDGRSFALTMNNGEYILESDTTQNYVYYTLPAGYESPVIQGIPTFSKRIISKTNRYDFELKKAKYDQHKHAFILWADPQVRDPEEFLLLEPVVEDVNKTIESFKNIPMHAISCGDQVFDRLNLIGRYKDVVSKVKAPFYQVVGNHDMDYTEQTNEVSTKTFEEQFEPAYYSFNKGDIHYVVLDDVFYYGYSYQYMGYFDQTQMNWLQADLKYVKKGSTVVIALHIPTKYNGKDANPSLEKLQKISLVNNKYFYRLLQGYNVHILAGHSHTQWNTVINDSLFEHTHAAACGAWWQGEIGLDGSPRGYTVYEVDGNNLTWYFKSVGLDKSAQFKLYPIGADIDSEGAFVANVFNYDPSWKVYWYEDGIKMGEMTQYWGVDPDVRKTYQPGTNKKYPWLAFDYTNHVFKAVPKNPKAEIRVEVIDRFGNKYLQILDQNKALFSH